MNRALRTAHDPGGCGAQKQILHTRTVTGNNDTVLLVTISEVQNCPCGMSFDDNDFGICNAFNEWCKLGCDGLARGFHMIFGQ